MLEQRKLEVVMMEMAVILVNQEHGNQAQYCHLENNYIHMKQTIFETKTFFESQKEGKDMSCFSRSFINTKIIIHKLHLNVNNGVYYNQCLHHLFSINIKIIFLYIPLKSNVTNILLQSKMESSTKKDDTIIKMLLKIDENGSFRLVS